MNKETIHYREAGWPTTICGRETLIQALVTTRVHKRVNCRVCLRKMEVLARNTMFAGEAIRDIEVEVWRGLPEWRRRACVRYSGASEGRVLDWYAYSRSDRSAMLVELIKDRGVAFRLGLPARPFESAESEIIAKRAREVLGALRDLLKNPELSGKRLPAIVQKQEWIVREVIGEAAREVLE